MPTVIKNKDSNPSGEISTHERINCNHFSALRIIYIFSQDHVIGNSISFFSAILRPFLSQTVVQQSVIGSAGPYHYALNSPAHFRSGGVKEFWSGATDFRPDGNPLELSHSPSQHVPFGVERLDLNDRQWGAGIEVVGVGYCCSTWRKHLHGNNMKYWKNEVISL